MAASSPINEDELLDQLLAEWFARTANNESADISDICEAQPQLADRMRKILSREVEVERSMKARRRSESDAAQSGTAQLALTENDVSEGLADFTVLSTIGRGGMGTVFLARQDSLNRLVALKVVRSGALGGNSTALRFQREAEIAAAIEHPNIVPVYAAGEDKGLCFIAMKLLRGPTLERVAGQVGPRDVAHMGLQLARALEATHEIGVVHRDVKPANVIVVEGRPYLLDFGFARTPDDITVTREGSVAGTLAYMAPEYLKDPSGFLHPRIDIYSLGATLYQAISGRPPFVADTPEALLNSVLTKEPRALDLGSEFFPLLVVLDRALAKEPTRRFDSAKELADELERYLEGRPILSRKPSALYRMRMRVRRNRLAASLILVTFMSLLAVGGTLWSQHRNTERNLSQGVQWATQRLREGKVALAKRKLSELVALSQDDARVMRLADQTAAEITLDRLVDYLQSPSEWQQMVLVSSLAKELVAKKDQVLRRDLWHLGQSVVAFREGREAAALSLLQKAGKYPRAQSALAALYSGEPISGNLATPSGSDAEQADDHVLTALALRLAHRSPSEREEEVRRAFEAQFGHYRATYALSVLRDEAGDSSGALALLLSLVEHEGHRTSVLLALARNYELKGLHTRAHQYLLRAQEHAASGDWPVMDILSINLRLAAGDTAEALRLYEAARLRWPQQRAVRLTGAYVYIAIGDSRKADDILESLAQDPGGDRVGHQAALAFGERRFIALGVQEAGAEDGGDLEVDERREIRSIVSQALRVSKATRRAGDKRLTSAAQALAAIGFRAMQKHSQAWEHLRQALLLDPSNIKARLSFAHLVALRTPALRGSSPEDPALIEACGALHLLLQPALEHARFVIANAEHLSDAERASRLRLAWICDAVLSYSLGDAGGTRRAARYALKLIEAQTTQSGGGKTAKPIKDLLQFFLS